MRCQLSKVYFGSIIINIVFCWSKRWANQLPTIKVCSFVLVIIITSSDIIRSIDKLNFVKDFLVPFSVKLFICIDSRFKFINI